MDGTPLFSGNIDKIIKEIDLIYTDVTSDTVNINYKTGNDPITQLDIRISNLFSKVNWGLNAPILDEENTNRQLEFPLFVLDPIDGTREFVKNIPEFAVSFAFLASPLVADIKNEGLIYNPATKELFLNSKKNININTNIILISRSEYDEDLFALQKDLVNPIGSIAYKLGKLSNGEAKGVVSLRPKNIWDIAAGTILADQSGYSFYQMNKKVEQLDQLIFSPPLVWCREEEYAEIQKNFDL